LGENQGVIKGQKKGGGFQGGPLFKTGKGLTKEFELAFFKILLEVKKIYIFTRGG